jgi:hypothetical protein
MVEKDEFEKLSNEAKEELSNNKEAEKKEGK